MGGWFATCSSLPHEQAAAPHRIWIRMHMFISLHRCALSQQCLALQRSTSRHRCEMAVEQLVSLPQPRPPAQVSKNVDSWPLLPPSHHPHFAEAVQVRQGTRRDCSHLQPLHSAGCCHRLWKRSLGAPCRCQLSQRLLGLSSLVPCHLTPTPPPWSSCRWRCHASQQQGHPERPATWWRRHRR